MTCKRDHADYVGKCPYCHERIPSETTRYPYTHHGQTVHGSKLLDYLISEQNLRDDHPELFDDETPPEGSD